MKTNRFDALAWVADELSALETRGLRRKLTTHAGPQQPRLTVGPRELVSFASNDYLGLAADPRLGEAAARAACAEGLGAGASPLITGHSTLQAELESRLAEFEGTEGALVFSSGFAANLGTVPALVGRGDAIYADQKNHASMIDGCRQSRAMVHVYPHRDVAALERLLVQGGNFRRRLIATETVFSMDGDLAPLTGLADLAERFDCMLLVDEAHATGVFGRWGRGVAELLGVEDRVHVRVGTLSKALGAAGGFVCGRRLLIEWLVNQARSYVFSTALPPPVCAAALAALDVVRDEPDRRGLLLERARELAAELREQGWRVGFTSSQIIPLVIGEPGEAVRLSARLRELGLWVPAIRPPSVPHGESLLRISLSYAHTPEMIAQLTAALADVRNETIAPV